MSTSVISIALIIMVTLFILITSLRRLPDLGMAFSLVLVGIVTWFRPGGLEQLGFLPVDNWLRLLGFSLVYGVLISLGALVLLEPLIEKVTGKPYDLSLIEPIRGDLRKTLWILLLVWILVAPLEEFIFRGFLMNELRNLLGEARLGLLVNLIFSSILFGLAHWYQGPSGVVSTAVVGMIIGVIFIWAGFNLWVVIFTHAFIDTISLTLIYLNQDRKLKYLLLKPKPGFGQENYGRDEGKQDSGV